MFPKRLRSREKKSQLVERFDWIFPKNPKKLILVVKKNTEFSGNLRVCADLILKYRKHRVFVYKDDSMPFSIRTALEKQGIIILEPNSWRSFYHILTSGTFVFSHVPRDAHLTKKHKDRKVLGLWHGVAFKNIESQMISVPDSKMQLIKNNAKLYDLLIASSETDKQYMARSFLVNENIVDVIGLPRYELLKASYPFDELLAWQEKRISSIISGRKFVLYAPTFRENGESAFDQIDDEEWVLLNKLLEKNNSVLGLRPHSYDNKTPPLITEDMDNIVWLSQEVFTESNLILQFVDVLIVDFSSIWIDFLLLNRPILGFAKDFNHYYNKERGFAYDFEDTFPDTFTHNVDELTISLNHLLTNDNQVKEYGYAKDKFHQHSLQTNYFDTLATSLKKLKVI